MALFPRRSVFVSDEAWSTVLVKAEAMGYLERGKRRTKGLTEFVTYLIGAKLRDTRPTYVKETDADMIEAGYTPEWQLYTPRRRRHVETEIDVLAKACCQAFELGMVRASDVFNGEKCLSRLLEAYGTGWIGTE